MTGDGVTVGEGTTADRRVGFGTAVGVEVFAISEISVAGAGGGMVARTEATEGETSSMTVGASVHAVTIRSASAANTVTEPRTWLPGRVMKWLLPIVNRCAHWH